MAETCCPNSSRAQQQTILWDCTGSERQRRTSDCILALHRRQNSTRQTAPLTYNKTLGCAHDDVALKGLHVVVVLTLSYRQIQAVVTGKVRKNCRVWENITWKPNADPQLPTQQQYGSFPPATDLIWAVECQRSRHKITLFYTHHTPYGSKRRRCI